MVDSGDAAAEGVAVPLITLVDYRFVPCRVVPFLVCAEMLTNSVVAFWQRLSVDCSLSAARVQEDYRLRVYSLLLSLGSMCQPAYGHTVAQIT